MNNSYDIVIIGGGPAGLAAAVAAYDSGSRSILILERDDQLGGIPKNGDSWKFMIIHNASKGFVSCGWPVCAHRDISAAATLSFK